MLKKLLLICFPIFTLIKLGFGQEQTFAGLTIKFNALTNQIFLNELAALEYSNAVSAEKLSKFAASLPSIEPILFAANVPDDFKFLSIYTKHQYSLLSKTQIEKGTCWGLTKEMAEEVNLLINDDIDERKHLLLATKGAAILIKRNQVLYENWLASLFAHIADKEVLKSLKVFEKWKTNYVVLDLPDYGPIIEFLAFKKYIEENYNKIANQNQQILYPYFAAEKKLGEIAERTELSIHEVVASNQWLQRGLVPDGDKYPVLLYIPIERYNDVKKLENSNSNLQEALTGFPILTQNQSYNKGKGGTFYTINGLLGIQAQMSDKFVNLAYKSDINIKKFLTYNDLKTTDEIVIGQVYYIEEKNDKAEIPYHIARPNETLWEVSQQYGISLKKLLDYNRLENAYQLHPGQLLWMRSKRPKNEPIQYVPLEERQEQAVLASSLSYNFTANANNEPAKVEAIKEEIVYIKPNITSSKKSSSGYSSIVEVASNEKFYEVKEGDTLESISVKYNIELSHLYKINNLASPELIVGEKLLIEKN